MIHDISNPPELSKACGKLRRPAPKAAFTVKNTAACVSKKVIPLSSDGHELTRLLTEQLVYLGVEVIVCTEDAMISLVCRTSCNRDVS